jgi:D-inositol-3-phosphate glycosyltransferase
MNIKIAFLGPSPPFRGGISQFALELAQEYQRSGHDIRMFTFERQYPRLLFPGGEQTTEFQLDEPLTTRRCWTPYLPWTWHNAVNEIRDFAPDVVIVSYFLPWFAPSYAWILRGLKGIRVICIAHNIDFHEKWLGADILTRWVFQQCERIVVLSQSCLLDLQRKMPLFIAQKSALGFHPIYGSYADKTEQIVQETTEQVILFFGLIKPYKGLDVLLHAFSKAQKAMPELRLVVAGEIYGSAAEYQNLIERLGIITSVETEFRYITDQEIGRFFRRAKVCVLPYKSATQSGVIATAYGFNVPVIASNVGGLSEYISEGETGLLVPPSDPDALAEALIRFFRQDLFAVMNRNIPVFKEKYSWNKLAELVISK